MDFEQLYNTYYMRVYSYLLTLSNNQSLAEELTQKTFVKALYAKNKFRSESGEFTWLCAIGKNLFLDEVRAKHPASEVKEHLDSGINIEHIVEDEDAMIRIHKILHTIEEPYKEVFQLRIFGELSFANIGLIFNKSDTWARVTYHRARLKIQERMEKK